MNLYRYCPYKYYLAYVKKLRQKENIHLLRGTIIHQVLSDFIRSENARDPTLDYSQLRDQLLVLLKSEWRANKERFLKLALQPQDMAFYFHDSERMLINWLHSYLKHNLYEYPKPQTEVMLFSRPDKVCGRIDAIYKVNGTPIIIDFKTSKYPIIDANLRMQLGIYAWLYEANFGERPKVAVHFVTLKDGLKVFPLTDTLLAHTKRQVQQLQHKLTQLKGPEDFPCTCRVHKACEKDFY